MYTGSPFGDSLRLPPRLERKNGHSPSLEAEHPSSTYTKSGYNAGKARTTNVAIASISCLAPYSMANATFEVQMCV